MAATFAVSVSAQTNVVRFVDPKATGQGNGTSWQDAYTSLQVAIDFFEINFAANNDNHIVVAEDTYQPEPQPLQFDPQSRAFRVPELLQFIEIHGGFLGIDGINAGIPVSINPDVPDGQFVRTILTGITAGVGNAYHVIDLGRSSPLLGVTQHMLNQRIIFDGFLIHGGRADSVNDPVDTRGGGAILLGPGRYEFENITFLDNWAVQNFSNTEGRGGAIYCSKPGNPVSLETSLDALLNVTRLDRCTFLTNEAAEGAAISLQGFPTLFVGNCTFIRNGQFGDPATLPVPGGPVTLRGGALYLNQETRLDASNSLFFDNSAEVAGGAIFWQPNATGSTTRYLHTIRHCTFTRSLISRDSVYLDNGVVIHAAPAARSATFMQDMDIRNSIIYHNLSGPPIALHTSVTAPGVRILVDHSDVGASLNFVGPVTGPSFGAGLFTTSSLNLDPLFVSNSANNFRLAADSPCINSGDGGSLTTPLDTSGVGKDIVDLDEDDVFEERLPFDLDGTAREVGVAPNMGSYEGS